MGQSKNKTIKKYFKMFVQIRGMKKLEASVKPGSYKNLWSAGQSVELIDEVQPVTGIVKKLSDETFEAAKRLQQIVRSQPVDTDA